MTLTLLALAVVLGFQLFRVLFPLAFDLSETAGSVNAGLLAFGIFLAGPLLAAPLRRALGARWALSLGLLGAAVVRAAIQLARPVPLWLAAVGVGSVLLGWTVLLHEIRSVRRDNATVIVVGLVLGMSIDTALRAVSWSWDLAWKDGAAPMLLTLALVGAILGLLPAGIGGVQRRSADGSSGPAAPVGAVTLLLLGPFLMLEVLFLQSGAFAASASGASLPVATALVLLGDGLAIAAIGLASGRRVGRVEVLIAAALLIVASALLRGVEGPVVGLAVLAGQPFAALLLFLGLSTGRMRPDPWRTSAAFAGGVLMFLVLTFLYQVHYDLPLPFPNAVLPTVAALILSAPVLLPRRASDLQSSSTWWAAVPLVLLAVPATLALARAEPQTEPTETRGRFRLVSYNVHMAVNTHGQVDPEAIARVIDSENPDVIVLQEVARGWVTNGMMDVAEWLSDRLGMAYVFAGAADGQFGNAIFSRLPILEHRSGLLGQFDGTMERGYVWAVVEVGGCREPVNVIVTHLQHREQDTPTRLRQIGVLLEAWGGASPAVIAGDMNNLPDSEEVVRFLHVGLVSAQDEAGLGNLPTSWQDDTRIDYIFATADLALSGFTRPSSRASDHLPLAVTVTPVRGTTGCA